MTNMRRAAIRFGALAVLAAVLPGVRGAEPDPARVDIKDFAFEPAELTVAVGTKVTWTNDDVDAHTVVSDSGLFRSSGLDTGETFSYTFVKPGTYHFTCGVHPKMVGTVIVK